MRQITQWRWHLDEVFVKIKGETHYLWRAVDNEGEILESYVTKSRNKSAALSFLKKAMKRYGSPRIVVTDRLRSYGAAMKEIGNIEYIKRCTGNGSARSNLPLTMLFIPAVCRSQPAQQESFATSGTVRVNWD